MKRYLAWRLVTAVVVVLLVSMIVFVLMHLLPGGQVLAILGPRARPDQIRELTRQLGYDQPLPLQYLHWLFSVLHGNLGYSYKLNESVSALIWQRLPKTVVLTGAATLFAFVLAVPLGIVQALKRNTVVDYALTGVSFVLYAVPSFFMGLLLILYLSIEVPLFPPTAPQSDSLPQILANWQGLVLPVLTLGLVTVAMFSRYMRSSLMENLTLDYVQTARSKGASEARIMLRHVLRNAMIPMVTLLGMSLPTIMAGALVTEGVFNYPGMGLLFWNAAENRDYPVLLGVTLIVGVASVVGSLLADIAYAMLDPRVRYG